VAGVFVDVAVSQEGTDGGKLADATQDRISVPGSYVVPVGGDEGIALVFGEPEPGRLEGGDEVDFPGTGADSVPIGKHNAVPVSEQVPTVGIAVNHPGQEREAEPLVGIQKLIAPLGEPGAFVLIDGAAGLDRPANGGQWPVRGQEQGGRSQPVQALTHPGEGIARP